MPSPKRIGKKYNFKPEDIDYIKEFEDKRDKETYPIVADYVVDVYKAYEDSSIIHDEDLEKEMLIICPDGELQNNSVYFICSRGGSYTLKTMDRRKKALPLEIKKKAMKIQGVKVHCRGCESNKKARRHNHIWRGNILRGTHEAIPCLPDAHGLTSSPDK